MQVSDNHEQGLEKNLAVNIVVDDAKREVHLMEAFITYRITTTIEKLNSPQQVFEVRRRYTEFEWLHARLMESFPGCVIPPLPDKNTLTNIDKFDEVFIALRLVACQKFLRRIVAHPQLKSASELRVFLTGKTWELETYRKTHPSANFFNKMGSQVKQLSERAANVQINKGGISFRAPARAADRFSEYRELADVSKDRLHTMVSQMNEICINQRSSSPAEAELASMFTQCANNEDTIRPALIACATALTLSAQLMNDRAEHMQNSTIPALHEYESFSESVKRALRNVDTPESEYQRLTAQLERGGLNPQKQAQIEEEAKHLKQQFESTGDDLHVDLKRWRSERDDELQQIFAKLAEIQVRKFEATIRAWEEAVQLIQNTIEPSSTDGY